jgi:hypothetical protein
MEISKEVLKELESFAAASYTITDNSINGCGEASGCNGSSGECACHGDGYVW